MPGYRPGYTAGYTAGKPVNELKPIQPPPGGGGVVTKRTQVRPNPELDAVRRNMEARDSVKDARLARARREAEEMKDYNKPQLGDVARKDGKLMIYVSDNVASCYWKRGYLWAWIKEKYQWVSSRY